ncbi:hypothetical protein GCM10009119_23220 [Algoriphagus jejuensis]|uniref:Uncharacterized protein n=2 Tax=Algoriphagus jejuensis TaxID=419934 RepID=A0ABP3YG09_9BACT
MNNMDFSSIGWQIGEKISELQLYSMEGKAVQLDVRTAGRATLLITGSYTCDETRGNLEGISRLHTKYKDHVDVFLVYTLEAHPLSTQSPYSAEPAPWHAMDNIKAGISAEQPRTMDERRQLAEQWIQEENISFPVLLDGPSNEFWNSAGQAPNMAILISEEGEIILKQAWFEENELEESLLKTP